MAKDKGPLFTLNEKTITDRSGNVGEAYLDGESWRVRLITQVEKNEARAIGLTKRMQDWYYHNHVKK